MSSKFKVTLFLTGRLIFFMLRLAFGFTVSIICVREREFKVVIKFAARVSMHQLRELLSGKQVDTPQEALSVIDIVLRELAAQRCICGCSFNIYVHCHLLNQLRLLVLTIFLFLMPWFFMFSYVSIGRFLYSPDLRKPQQLGGGLESWRGFYQSIRPTQMGLSLNIGESSIIFTFFLFYWYSYIFVHFVNINKVLFLVFCFYLFFLCSSFRHVINGFYWATPCNWICCSKFGKRCALKTTFGCRSCQGMKSFLLWQLRNGCFTNIAIFTSNTK